MVPFRGEPDEVAARAARSEEKILADIGRLQERWDDELLPEILDHLGWWDAFDLEAASDDDLLEHVRETWERGRRMWQLHFMAIVPAYIALSEFEELYRDLLGDSGLEAFTLLGGAHTKNVEIGVELWRLSRSALRDDAVRTAIETASGDELDATLEATDAGRAWLQELRGFLTRYGERGDTWVLSAPSWIEDPSMVIKNIRDLLAMPDADAPGIATAKAAEERDTLAADVRERLQGYPALAVEQFESLLAAARVAAVIQDDHNFYIDFCSSYRVRRVICEAARRLVRDGSIEAVTTCSCCSRGDRGSAGQDRRGARPAGCRAPRRHAGVARGRAAREPRDPAGVAAGRQPGLPLHAEVLRDPPAPSGEPGVISGLSRLRRPGARHRQGADVDRRDGQARARRCAHRRDDRAAVDAAVRDGRRRRHRQRRDPEPLRRRGPRVRDSRGRGHRAGDAHHPGRADGRGRRRRRRGPHHRGGRHGQQRRGLGRHDRGGDRRGRSRRTATRRPQPPARSSTRRRSCATSRCATPT